MFLLHGIRGDHTVWIRRSNVERYVADLPLIVVMPDAGRSFYCDAVEGPAYGQALGEELPAMIRQWFPTRPGWAITGLSMGGYGALRLALTYPETFTSAASISGALAFGHYYGWDTKDDFGREFRRVLGAEPVGGPADLFSLVTTADPRPALWIDCGTEDFLLSSNHAFRDHLAANEISHEYSENPGEHTWDYWDEHVQRAIAFHRRQLGF
jgi:S-formylglutathione hydrolase FrmB